MVIALVEVTEKRSVTIRPTRIDKELLIDLGQILRAECSGKHGVLIGLDADSKEIRTGDSKELANIEIPSDTYMIRMAVTSSDVSFEIPIHIEMDLRKPRNSKIRVIGKNPTWVQGVTERLSKVFERKKLGYRHIARFEIVRAIMSMIASGLLSYVGGFTLWHFRVDPTYVLCFVVVFFYAMGMLIRRFFDWVFPYFEIENKNFLPRRVRKWALVILWGSGIIPTILFKILGF